MLINKEILLASPFEVFNHLMLLVKETGFWKSVLLSFSRISAGYLSAVVIASSFAVLTTTVPFLKELFYPLISLVKATPVASFIILALVWIKKDGVPVFITFLMVFPIVWANVSEGIASTDKRLLEVARVFRFSRFKTVKSVYVPTVLPYFNASCTTALGLAWKAGVAAEVIAMPESSIGYHLYRSKINIETADLFAWTVVVILLSVCLEKLVAILLKRIKGGQRND